MNKIARYICIIGIFIIPFIPLIVSYSHFFPFITGKNFTFRIVTEIILASWIILALTDKSYRPKKSLIFCSFAFLVAIMTLADIFSINPFKSFWSNYERMEGWITLAHLFAYFVVVISVMVKEKIWDSFFQTSLGANLAIVLYSILQTAHLLVINQGGVRTDSTLGNATYLAIYAVFNIFIAALFLVRNHDNFRPQKNIFIALGFNIGFFVFLLPMFSRAFLSQSVQPQLYLWAFLSWIVINLGLYLTVFAKQERVFLGFIIILDAIVLFNTATRGAILGLIFGVVVMSVLLAIFEKKDKFVRKTAITLLVCSAVIVLGFLSIRNTQFVKEHQVLSRFSSISLTERTTLSRFKLWAMSFDGFKQRPILGWGQESFNYVFNYNYNPELYNQEPWFDRTHNVIFDWLISGGILGLGSYLAFFFLTIYMVWKKKHGGNTLTLLEKTVMTGMLSAYFINNLFVFDNITSYLMFVSVAAYVHHRTSAKNESVHSSGSVDNRLAVPVVIVALLVVLYVVNIPSYLASKTLIEILSKTQAQDLGERTNLFKKAIAYNGLGNQELVEQLVSFSGQVAASQQPFTGKTELFDFTREQISKQLERTPKDARIYVIASTFYFQNQEYKNALDLLMTAHKLSPQKQSIDFSIASLYMTQGDYANTYEWLKQAYELNKEYMDARLVFASSAIYLNKDDVVKEVLSGLPTSTIAASNDILQAYYATKQYDQLIKLWEERVKQQELAKDPELSKGHVSLAAAYLLVNKRAAAIVELQKAIEIDPAFKTQGEEFIKQIKEGRTF